MSVYNAEAFHERVNFAARSFLSGNTSSRAFDTCFEMYDGDLVVTALVRRCARTPFLHQAITDCWGGKFPEGWITTAAKYSDVTNLAGKARSIRAVNRAETQLMLDELRRENQTEQL